MRRLVTLVDLAEDLYDHAPFLDGPASASAIPGLAPRGTRRAPDPGWMSVDAVLTAELEDGRRVTVLDDRGWTSCGPGDIWSHTSAQDMADTARTVVGPDEPYEGQSQAQAAAEHWAALAVVLQRAGVRVDADELSRLPHEVELSARVRSRLSRP